MNFIKKIIFLVYIVNNLKIFETKSDSICIFNECTCDQVYDFIDSVTCNTNEFPKRVISKSNVTNIKYFEQSSTSLTEIPADRLYGLDIQFLNLEQNLIEKISENAFHGISSLNSIVFSNNQIKKFEKLTFEPLGNSLLHLDLNYNNLGEGDVNKFSETLKPLVYLERLDLNGNYFKAVPDLSILPELKNLYLEDNLIEKLPQNEKNHFPSNLVILSLFQNNLTEITRSDFSHLTKLEYLNLESNQIQNINSDAFKFTSSLKELILRDNLLKKIPSDAIYYLPDLLLLDLSAQREDLNEIQDYAFDRVQDKIFTKLDLSYNNINKIDKKAFCTSNPTNSYVNLDLLDLTGNPLPNLESCHYYQLNRGYIKFVDSTLLKVNIYLNSTNQTYLECDCEVSKSLQFVNLNGVCKDKNGVVLKLNEYQCKGVKDAADVCMTSEYECFSETQKGAVISSSSQINRQIDYILLFIYFSLNQIFKV